MLDILICLPVLIAAGLIGNWFLAEVRKSRQKRELWYKPYFTIPGIMILLAFTLPAIVFIIIRSM